MGFPNPTTSTVVKIVHTTETMSATTLVLGRFSTESMPYYINIFSEMVSPVGMSIDFDWYDEAVGGNRVDNNTVHMSALAAGNIARGSFPVISPWVEITVRSVSAPVDLLIDIWLSAVPTQGDGVNASASNVLITVDGTSIATATPTTFDTVGHTRWGWGTWSAQFIDPATGVGAANWRAQLYSLSRTGAAQLLDSVGSGAFWTPRPIFLPSNTVQLRVVHADGANRTLYATVRFHPGPL